MGKTAVGYNDTIIEPQLEVVEKMDSIFSNPDISYSSIQKFRTEMVESAKKGLEESKKLDAFKGNDSFKNAAVTYFSFVQSYFSSTDEIDSILYKFNSDSRIETLSDEQYDNAQTKFEQYLELEDNLLEEQQKFAKEFQVKLDQ